MKLSDKIIEIRKNNNLNQEDLAEVLNVSRQTISNWENDKCYPDVETLIIISDKFNISLDNLLKDNMIMVKNIDNEVKKSSKLKKIIFILCTILLIVTISFLSKNYLDNKKFLQDKKKYQEILINLNVLGFEKQNEIGFSKINENKVEYSIYSKFPYILEKHISATTNVDDLKIIADYDGKRVAVTYISDVVSTIIVDTKGNLKNEKQNKKYTEIYNSKKDKTIEMVTRMVELSDDVYK